MNCTWQGVHCSKGAGYIVLSGCLYGHVRQRMLCEHHMEVYTGGADTCWECNTWPLEHHSQMIPEGFIPEGTYN